MDKDTIAALVDPELRTLLGGLGRPPAHLGDIARVRTLREQQMAAQLAGFVLPEGVTRDDICVPGAVGDPDVRMAVWRPSDAKPGDARPCLYWTHGGGYIMGSHDADASRFAPWILRHGWVCVSVDYRLAPETPHPGPVEDAYAGLRWTHANATSLGAGPNRIVIGGPSAGGGLAAGLGLITRDRGEIALIGQLLIYPMIDDRQVTPSSQWPVPVWDPEWNRLGWRAYLGDRYGTDDISMYAAPARATDLRGLPPTYVTVGALDGFLDEDIDYAQRLTRAGVSTELHVHPGAPHGFESAAPTSAVGQRARKDYENWLVRIFAG